MVLYTILLFNQVKRGFMHSHNHDHNHSHTDELSSATPFKKALIIGFLFMLVEVVGGIVANSLALITDALHLSTDVGSLALALVVMRIVALPKNQKMSYGYQRAEILGALASSLFLLVLCGFLIYESIVRFLNPAVVDGKIISIIAIIGLLANIWMMRILHPIQQNDLNTKAAYLHVLGDLLASVGVVVGGLIIWQTGWSIVDPIVTLIISVVLCYSSSHIIRKSVSILMQAAPEGLHPSEIEKTLAAIPGVIELHDLHVWAVSSKHIALSVHIIAESSQAVLKEAHRIIEEKFDIHYMTIQVEEPNKFESRFCYDTMPPKENC
jgi:cobalt-zinc-cadmium efflux system protein